MKHWTFYDFVTLNGRNAVSEWIDSQPAGTRQRLKSALNTLLLVLEEQAELDRPTVGQLRGKPCKGLFELVLRVDKIQFRPIGCYGPKDNEFTILAGAHEKDRRLQPPDICDVASDRKQHVLNDRSRIRVHRFD